MARYVLPHRVIPRTSSGHASAAENIVREILESVRVPA
jgi:hypothetical protein